MNNYYNEEANKNNKLIDDLKKLPQVKAPEDFEFNLMTRIQNKNFETVAESSPGFSLAKFLAPSAVVVAAVLLFFVFYPKDKEIPNFSNSNSPTVTVPPVSVENSVNTIKETASNVPVKNSSVNPRVTQSPAVQKNEAPQPAGTNTIDQLIRDQNSISLDDYISGDNSNQKDIKGGSVVTSKDQVPDFDGFFVKQKTDPATLKRYREVVDSLNKAQLKLDSLKKASKLP